MSTVSNELTLAEQAARIIVVGEDVYNHLMNIPVEDFWKVVSPLMIEPDVRNPHRLAAQRFLTKVVQRVVVERNIDTLCSECCMGEMRYSGVVGIPMARISSPRIIALTAVGRKQEMSRDPIRDLFVSGN